MHGVQLWLAEGHIADACADAPFESKWARVRAQVADQSREGPIGATSNWGVPSQLGELLLAEPVHRLYRSSALTTLASSILEDDDVFACHTRGTHGAAPGTNFPCTSGSSVCDAAKQSCVSSSGLARELERAVGTAPTYGCAAPAARAALRDPRCDPIRRRGARPGYGTRITVKME